MNRPLWIRLSGGVVFVIGAFLAKGALENNTLYGIVLIVVGLIVVHSGELKR